MRKVNGVLLIFVVFLQLGLFLLIGNDRQRIDKLERYIVALQERIHLH